MKLPWGMRETDNRCVRLKEWISTQIEEFYHAGYRVFLCGMAIGCDTYFADAVLALKEKYPDLLLSAAIPCADQSNRWNRKQKEKYASLIAQCDEIKIFQEHYTTECMRHRNMYMVDHSSAMIACFDGRPGGTMSTLVYARREGLDIRLLDINELGSI